VDSIGGVEKLSEAYGVTLSSSPSTTSVAYDPRGFGSLGGGSVKFMVTRNGKRDSVMVDGLGRVIK
jgi:hypothetical protein